MDINKNSRLLHIVKSGAYYATAFIFLCSLGSLIFLSVYDVYNLHEQHVSYIFPVLSIFILSLFTLIFFHSSNLTFYKEQFFATKIKLEQLQSRMLDLTIMSFNDDSTGLPNRFKLFDYLDKQLSEPELRVALCLMDLDDLRNVNDTLGHKVGDQVISIVADRINALTERWNDATDYTSYLACLGSDEFVVLITGFEDNSELSPLLEELLFTVRQKMEIGNNQIFMGASIGVSLTPEHAQDSETMLKNADMALFRVKQASKHDFSFYQPHYREELEKRIQLEYELIDAIANNEFEVYYQPVINTQNNTILGFEALVRWHHPVKGMVPPDDFIPIAEQTGLIVEIGEWIIKQVCSDLSILQIQDHDYSVAINIASQQLEDHGFVQKVQAILTCYALRPSQIHFELTETSLMNANEHSHRVLREINNLGIKLWVDDFGTGYSSFSYLQNFNFYGLKLDKSFVENIISSSRSKNIIQAICAMADALNLELLGEGIEHPEQVDVLSKLGCIRVQGYWYAKPMSISNLHLWTSNWDRNDVKSLNVSVNSSH